MPRINYVAGPYEHVVMRDGVVVVAVDTDQRVALVRHTVPLHGETLSVPGGTVDDGEDPAQAARRELAEETGVRAASWQHVGTFVPMPRSTQRVHVFEAADLTLGLSDLQPGEVAQGMTLEWWPLPAAVDAIWQGRVRLSGSALALLAYTARPRSAPITR